MSRERLTQLHSEDIRASMTRIESVPPYAEKISSQLGQIVYGQEEACDAVARRLAIFDVGLGDPNRPLGVEFFLGSTGVGKTEMSHAVADYMFGDKDHKQLKIIDCAEFSVPHSVTRLTGAPPSYVGYGAEPLISEDFLANRNILVFDEVEKAHPEFHKLLLGIMEDGRMRSTGRGKQDEMNFSNSLIIMTSNVGAREVEEGLRPRMGFQPIVEEDTHQRRESISRKALKDRFAPEFVNRIDDIIVFKDLESHHYDHIFYKFINEINEDLRERSDQAPFIAVTTEFKDYILSQIDTKYGARDMRRVIDRELLEKLSDVFMGMDMRLKPIVADYADNKTDFYTDDEDHSEYLAEEDRKLYIVQTETEEEPVCEDDEDSKNQ